ncbi:MAG: DUF1152 domain-containing protein [Candidatus Sericytochromatia bacterium]
MLTPLAHSRLGDCQNILLAGCGGGYDIFGALPLFKELAASGRNVHLASLSFCYLDGLGDPIPVPGFPNLYPIVGADAREDYYCPEAWLARWLEAETGFAEPIWCFTKTGVRPLAAAYRHLVEQLHIDCIILIDGGVDSLMAGHETSIGTPAEDLVSLAAVQAVEGPVKLLACVGFGAEIRDGICHEQVLARVAGLQKSQGFLGVSSLLAGSDSGEFYRQAVEYAFAHQLEQRQSHIHRVILQAMRGDFGQQEEHIWISPLMNMFWFFELEAVVASHVFLKELRHTMSLFEVSLLIDGLRNGMQVQDRTRIPI